MEELSTWGSGPPLWTRPHCANSAQGAWQEAPSSHLRSLCRPGQSAFRLPTLTYGTSLPPVLDGFWLIFLMILMRKGYQTAPKLQLPMLSERLSDSWHPSSCRVEQDLACADAGTLPCPAKPGSGLRASSRGGRKALQPINYSSRSQPTC